MVTSKIKPPFNSSVKRFGKMTVHPNLDLSGLYTARPNGCNPCLYHPQPLHKIFEINKNRKLDKNPWTYKKELEDWATNLGYRNENILKDRRWFDSILGPAWHTVTELPRYEPVCNNVGFGRTPRARPSKISTPCPGTYYKAVPFKQPYGPHSRRSTFKREEPCRFKDMGLAWSLAPDRYKIIDKDCIEQKSKKLVSLRGPYDLFTGKRDGSTIKNHFNISLKCSAATWPIALKGTLDKYNKSNFGVMNKTSRSVPYRGRNAIAELSMCIRKPEDPCAVTYNVDEPKVFVENKRGFNSSYDKPPGYQRVIVWPGVGRYSVKKMTCGIPGQGHKHVFLSKLGRTIGAIIPQPMNSF